MTFSNSAISDILATTIQSRTRELADNLTQNNAILMRLDEKGKIKPITGGYIIYEEMMYDDPNTSNVNSYNGSELLNIAPDSPISAAQFIMKQYAASVVISGKERLINSGKEKMIDLLNSRLEISEARLRNRLSQDLYGDGTGNGGKNLDGLAAMIPRPTKQSPATPGSPQAYYQYINTGNYGGIDRSIWRYWNPYGCFVAPFQNGTSGNYTYTSGFVGGTPGNTGVNALDVMTNVSLQLTRGKDKVDLIMAGSYMYGQYVKSLQTIQRITDEKMAAAGFASLKFYGGGSSCDVVLGGGYAGPLNIMTNEPATPAANSPAAYGQEDSFTMYFLNTDYIHFRPHVDCEFTPLGKRMSVNQDAVVETMLWAGNLTCSNQFLQGVVYAPASAS